MRALRVEMRLAVVILAGLSGCYGRYVGPGPCMPGMGGCYGLDGCNGEYAAGYGAYADGCGPYLDGYGAYANFGQYGDCYAGYADGLGFGAAAGYYGSDPLPVRQAAHERLSLRERRLARRDARASRRDRRGPRQHRGRRSRGEIGCDSYCDCDVCASPDCGGCCCQSGGCGPCGGCDSGPYVAYLMPMASSCGPCEPCGPWMECDPCFQDSVCCDGCGSEVVYDGMPSQWSEPYPSDGYPSPSCAGGSCGVEGGEWETTIPYSHEVSPAEPVPYPIKPRVKDEPPYVPPSKMPPEGPFKGREGGNSVGIRSQGMTPSPRPRLVPAAF